MAEICCLCERISTRSQVLGCQNCEHYSCYYCQNFFSSQNQQFICYKCETEDKKNSQLIDKILHEFQIEKNKITYYINQCTQHEQPLQMFSAHKQQKICRKCFLNNLQRYKNEEKQKKYLEQQKGNKTQKTQDFTEESSKFHIQSYHLKGQTNFANEEINRLKYQLKDNLPQIPTANSETQKNSLNEKVQLQGKIIQDIWKKEQEFYQAIQQMERSNEIQQNKLDNINQKTDEIKEIIKQVYD